MALATLTSFAALAANVALMTAAPYLISKATLVTGFAALALAVTAVRGFAIARAALRYSERYVVHLAALRILTQIRVRLYRAIEPLAPGGLRAFRSGDLLARTVGDVDTLDAFFVRGVVPLGAAILLAALACGILALFAPVLALVLLVALSLGGIALPLAVRHLAHRPAERMVRARADLYARFADDLSGLADLLVFGRDGRLAGDLVTRSSAIGREQRTLAFIRGGSAAAGTVLAGSAGLAVLALAIPWVRSADLEGVFLASLPLVAFAAYEAVLPLGDAFREVEASRAAAVRTFEIVDAPATVAEPSHPHAPPAHPSLEFRSVRFRYEEGSPLVLDDLSFSVRPGEALGITGPSGAGKTTLVTCSCGSGTSGREASCSTASTSGASGRTTSAPSSASCPNRSTCSTARCVTTSCWRTAMPTTTGSPRPVTARGSVGSCARCPPGWRRSSGTMV